MVKKYNQNPATMFKKQKDSGLFKKYYLKCFTLKNWIFYFAFQKLYQST